MRILWFVANLARRKTAIYSPVPSVRLRCLMPAHRLTEMHPDWQINVVNLGEIKPSDFELLDSADVAIFGKVFFDHQPLYEYLSSQRIPIVMDLCDDIYHFAHLSEAYQLITQYHSKTVVSCAALEAEYRQHGGAIKGGNDSIEPNVSQISDCVEGERCQPRVESFAAKTDLNCLWYGIPHNLNFLIYDLPNFKKLSHYKIHIKILTSIDEEVEQWLESAKKQYSPGITFEVLKWDFDLQFEALQQCDVVLVPSAENQVFRVKTANRVITALWAGKPCVAYPLPSYQQFQPYIPIHKSTAEGILELIATPTKQVNQNIEAAQQLIADQYSLQHIAECWESVINEVIAAPRKTPNIVATEENNQSADVKNLRPNPTEAIPQSIPQADTPFAPIKPNPIALNLGCGDKILTGYINVDVVDERAGNHPDVICDIRKLDVFEDDYADEILTVHVIEHFYHWEAKDVLLEWLRVLKPGGKMVVECPNLLTACEEILKNPQQATGPGPEGQRSMWVLYGDPAWQDPLMCHKWLYTPYSLSQLMASCGMENVLQEDAQYKLKAPRDMRLVGYKPEKTKQLPSEEDVAPASMTKPSLIDMIGAVGARV